MAVMTILKPSCCEASGTISLQSINGSTSTTSMVCEHRRKEGLRSEGSTVYTALPSGCRKQEEGNSRYIQA
ncbi:hypothetical protein L484_018193 [Morus notabilis]|uniref:Uncharacterized protein n=1 Tax=Morus notabilis TaxID=981085 RepID=W9R9L5_9ROSA|nr:hypothetical protein L484_018193 [Morus notabilis]